MSKVEKIGNISSGRDAILGDQINITYTLQMPAFQPPADLKALRRTYLEHLQRTYHALDFKGVPQLQTLSRELPLKDVYVPLLARPEMPEGETARDFVTRGRGRLAGRLFEGDEIGAEILAKAEALPVPVEEALRDHPRTVVLGDPGSGKTTLVKHFTLRLAGEPHAPLPVLVPLNAYAAALQREDLNLQAFLPKYFAGFADGLARLQPLFDTALAQGQTVILLDGLDEVQANRPFLVKKVEAFAAEATAHGNKVLLTSRIVGYKEAPLSAQQWTLYTLLDFDRPAIERFADKWCLAFEKSTLGDTPEAIQKAETERRGLLEALDANPGVAQLASNPLLLTILALIKRQGVNLPNRRVELYELYLKTLITAWSQARALDKRPVGPPLDYLETIAILGPLALWLREENPTAGLVSEEKLLEWLTGHFQGDEWGLKRGEARHRATDFLHSVRKYSNLLVERGQNRYGFMHLTFEEALAARGLERLGKTDMAAALAHIQTHLTDPGWRETILLAVGVWGIVRETPHLAGQVVQAMLKMPCPTEQEGQNILLAGACVEDVGVYGVGRATIQIVQDALLAACRNRRLPPATQRDAGFSLARTGWRPKDLDEFIRIPAGPFLYGGAFTKPQKHSIEKPFEIAKYPVTNLQYQKFMEAGGYEDCIYWSGEGWTWRIGKDSNTLAKGDLARPIEKRSEPLFWRNHELSNPLAPVVGVTWFEAEAFCNWLTKKLGKPIRLPMEDEWERAARGTDGRKFPWGEEFDCNLSNSMRFWRKERYWFLPRPSTTIVGQFSEGNSPSGLCDMSGNVKEWTYVWYDKKYHVLRGSSWNDDGTDNVRCTSRLKGLPDDEAHYFIGFRVVSPGFLNADF